MQTIKINQNFEIRYDRDCWILYEFRSGINRKTGEPTRGVKQSYFPLLIQCCNEIINRSGGYEGDVKDIVNAIENASEAIQACFSEIQCTDIGCPGYAVKGCPNSTI
jgi:hypothetical protein